MPIILIANIVLAKRVIFCDIRCMNAIGINMILQSRILSVHLESLLSFFFSLFFTFCHILFMAMLLNYSIAVNIIVLQCVYDTFFNLFESSDGMAQWWEVELEEEHCITMVTIVNRADCCRK